MSKDLSPEDAAARGTTASTLTMDEAAAREDLGAQPGPEEFDTTAVRAEAVGPDLSVVKWPASDRDAPDYRYLAAEPAPDNFTLTPTVIEALLSANRYEPYREKGVIAFALRGAKLRQGHEVEKATQIDLKQVRPDHREFRCVIGFYHLADQRLTAFTASTVPCRLAIYSYKNGGSASNMLPTGLYSYYIWRHKAIRPALRLGVSRDDPETGAEATVLRNRNNYQLETRDRFDLSRPLDNVHCAYYTEENDRLGASFSSWGCLTVRGTPDPSHQWKKFQAVLDGLGQRTRVDLMLATGKDAAVASAASGDPAALGKLTTLRQGSRGAEVSRLQARLGVAQSGFFGPGTADKLTGYQRTLDGNARLADGIYARAIDTATGWNVFEPQPPTA